jgi:hypothetical protein
MLMLTVIGVTFPKVRHVRKSRHIVYIIAECGVVPPKLVVIERFLSPDHLSTFEFPPLPAGEF